MDYTPHTEQDIKQMLDLVGATDVMDLFDPVPQGLRLDRPLDIPPPMSESEVFDLLAGLSSRNTATDELRCFAGGGAYDHYIPAAVRHLAYRAEFVTSYTPYQPELSQGVLGVLFEYQSMICELTGMDVANASLYDGASSLVEAVNLATSATGRKKVCVSAAISPKYRKVLETFGVPQGIEFLTLDASKGQTELLETADAACVIIGQPNYYGVIEDVAAAADAAHSSGAMLVVHFDPLSAGLIEAPGAQGADVVTGEGQSLGNDLNFGGPYLGIFATKIENVRRVPGRICGATVDTNGDPGFVLTLQAREQHIRREKANSNVCTNQTLMAIVATVYLSWLGPKGLEELGRACYSKAHQAAELLSSVPGCSLLFEAPFFKEFVLKVPKPAKQVARDLADRGFLIGPAASPDEDCILVAVTEKRTSEQIEALAKALADVVA